MSMTFNGFERFRVILHWTDKRGRNRSFRSKPFSLNERSFQGCTDKARKAFEAAHRHEIDRAYPIQDVATECI